MSVAAPAPAAVPVPESMAALGDSYTVGLFSGGSCSAAAICPANSWSTGTAAAVNSHYSRLRALDTRISTHNYNYATSARKVSDLARQAELAIAKRVEYVTILIGLNDSCRESEAAMTPVTTFRTQFASGLGKLVTGLPDARILVGSIPDAERLRTILKDNPSARAAWSAQGVCTVALGDPLSDASDVVARRERARQRVVDFNRQLADVCAQHPTCRYDGGAVFRWAFEPADFVTRDYFHLSVAGQAGLATTSWAAGYDFAAGSPPPPPPPPPPPSPPADYAGVVIADGPAGYWRMDDASGTVASALAGPAGRYLGAFRLGALGAVSGNAAVALLGSTGYISVPDAAALDTADTFTLEAWVKRGAIGRSQGLFAKGPRSYQFYFDATNRLVLRQTGIGEIARTTVALTDRTTFHHIAVTKSGSAVHLYVDGVDRTSAVTNRVLTNTTSALALGSGSGTLNGTLDEVAVYNRALDAAAIARRKAAAG